MTQLKNNKTKDDVTRLQDLIRYHLKCNVGKLFEDASRADVFTAVCYAVRAQLIDKLIQTEKRYESADAKRLYYLSMEFLVGRALGNNLYNLGIFDLCKQALQEMGFDLEEIRDKEGDAALGNGGLGRLAACFLDSLATLDMPGFGYGINYEYGVFKQEIENGYQKEKPDHWLRDESPWLIKRTEESFTIPIYGRLEMTKNSQGELVPVWVGWKTFIGVPYDMPIVGHGGNTVNYLRLFSAQASDEFDMQIFNTGDYFKAVQDKIYSENISKVLYPSDSVEPGRELRLVQEYFLVACSVRDVVRKFLKQHGSFDDFPNKVAIQLNDTHPALTVVELMRIFMDEHNIKWEKAWELTKATLGYTNHTLLPEALEKWSASLLGHVLPRHLQIIYELNQRFLQQVVARWPNDTDRVRRMSLIEEGNPQHVRMAYLSIIGSHSVNGVAAIHSELVKKTLVPDFYEMSPEKFNNKTNGVTPRRWLHKANPLLSDLISGKIGEDWIADLDQLKKIVPFAKDPGFQQEFLNIKKANKERLSKIIFELCHVYLNNNFVFDVHIKRFHEYKRQLLNVMHIIHQYLQIIEDGEYPAVPKAYIFAGKAAPSYSMAKLIIKLIHNMANVINNDTTIKDYLKVVFIPDYRVSLTEKIVPAAELSEQISTAGTEASGTGNMKFAMNGALTIGTLDGANVEIKEEVGSDNIYIFGRTVEEIEKMRGLYHPFDYYQKNEACKRVMDAIGSDLFCKGEPGLFTPIYDRIMNQGDHYFHLADLQSYIDIHKRAAQDYKNRALWAEKSILNTANTGKFSSDRTIKEYAKEIWHISSIPK